MIKIVVLHVCALTNNKSSGLSVIVPEHIKYQSKVIRVGVLNCTEEKVLKLHEDNNQDVFYLKDIVKSGIKSLPEPFNQPDIVNFHGIYIYEFTKIAKYLYKSKIPYIITPHGSLTYFAQSKKKLKKNIANKLVFNKFIDRASAIQYLTKEERKRTVRKTKKEIVIGNGMNIKQNYKRIIIKKSEFNIVFIGRIDPYCKGIDLLIEACTLIKSDMKKYNIKIKIFGPDFEGGKEEVVKMIQKNRLEEIIYLGNALYDTDKDKQLNKSDLFILTSRYEGQPVGALEAISKGIPVIVTEGTNISEEVERYKCGFTAKTNSRSIAEQILKAYNSREKMEEYSENCLVFASREFSWEKIIKDIVKCYRSIIDNH